MPRPRKPHPPSPRATISRINKASLRHSNRRTGRIHLRPILLPQLIFCLVFLRVRFHMLLAECLSLGGRSFSPGVVLKKHLGFSP